MNHFLSLSLLTMTSFTANDILCMQHTQHLSQKIPVTILRNIINATKQETAIRLVNSNGKVAFLLQYDAGIGHSNLNYPITQGSTLTVKAGGEDLLVYSPSGRTSKIDLIIGDDQITTRVVSAGSR
jgi:hypothetical protein